MNIPEELRYAKTHEWARKENGEIAVGITDYAQHEISDVVYVELPKAGKKVEQEKPCAVVESVKAAFDIYPPVTGEVVRVNVALSEKPEQVNQDPYGEGWFFVIRAENTAQYEGLLTASRYRSLIEAEKK